MAADRVIAATFATWRPVNGRKVLQLVFEVPIEKQGDVLTMLGAPDDKWCAIALLKERPTGAAPQTPLETAKDNAERLTGVSDVMRGPKTKRAFSELSLPEQAGIRCEDSLFASFICDQTGLGNSADIPQIIRDHCGVLSRAELATDQSAALKWRKLEEIYQRWLTDKRYADMKR